MNSTERRMEEPRNRVVQLKSFGGPDRLVVVDASIPTAGRGEVWVRVLASGIEYTDGLIRRHLYPRTGLRRPPFVMGYDVVGEIDQVGEGVSGARRFRSPRNDPTEISAKVMGVLMTQRPHRQTEKSPVCSYRSPANIRMN